MINIFSMTQKSQTERAIPLNSSFFYENDDKHEMIIKKVLEDSEKIEKTIKEPQKTRETTEK